jgi:hypothetical protein
VKFLFVLVSFITFSYSQTRAQQWEFGGWVGISNYFGDLNTNTSFEYLGPGGGLLMRYNWSKRWAYKISFNAGKVGFEDVASGYPYQKARNLSFNSNIFELANEIEFNFFRYEKERTEYNFTPYLTTGFSVLYFNPTTLFEGKKYNLRDYGTEGQKNPDGDSRPYSRINFAFILGGGFKYSFHPRWTLGMEAGVRRTFTPTPPFLPMAMAPANWQKNSQTAQPKLAKKWASPASSAATPRKKIFICSPAFPSPTPFCARNAPTPLK